MMTLNKETMLEWSARIDRQRRQEYFEQLNQLVQSGNVFIDQKAVLDQMSGLGHGSFYANALMSPDAWPKQNVNREWPLDEPAEQKQPEPRRDGMNQSLNIFLINNDARAVLCTYEADDTRVKVPTTMFKTLDPGIKVGDYVVVPTETRHKMTVVKVAEVDVDVDFESHAPVAWIIGVVDRADHESLLAQEADANKKISAALALKKRNDLREALIGLNAEQLKALPLTNLEETPKPETPPSA